MLTDLRMRFPVFAEFLPLARGIENELQPYFPNDPNWRIIAALRRHVNDTRYLKTALSRRQRHNLMGQAIGEVSPAERAYMRAKLRKLAESGEGGPEDADPMEDLKNGQRLMLCAQVDHLFGAEMATTCRPYLEQIAEEKVLEELGVDLLRAGSAEDWLEALRSRVPDLE